MTKFTVAKNALIPADEKAIRVMAKHRIGDVLDVEVLNPINQKFNALMMATIAKLAAAQGVTTETMKTRLLVMTGRFQMVPLMDHRKALVVDSMSRAHMTQDEREQFWNEMCALAEAQILPHIAPREADEIRQMMADERSNQAAEKNYG